MVNEKYEVQQYLNGENISKENLYRSCYLIAKWFNEQGLTRLEIRNKLFQWGKENNIYIKYNINNDIIDKLFNYNSHKLKSVEVKINKQDVENINKRFDHGKTKLVALAMLCYAKAHASQTGEFIVSSVNMGCWLNINRKSLRQKHIKELIDYEYLIEVSRPANKDFKTWTKAYEEQSIKYKLNVPIDNYGEYELERNDVRKLYADIFVNAI